MIGRVLVVVWAVLIGTLAPIIMLRTFYGANADELSSLMLFGDLWKKIAPFRWTLQPANGMFPDLLIAAAGYAVGLDGMAYYLYYGSVYAVLSFVLTAVVLKFTRVEWVHAWPAAALAVLLICLADPDHAYVRLLLFLMTGHSGVVLVALLCFALVARFFQEGTRAGMVLFVLLALSTFSDKLAILQIALPILATLVLIGWQQPQLRRAAVGAALVITGAVVLGLAMYSIVRFSRIIAFGKAGIRPAEMLQAANAFIQSLPRVVEAVGSFRAVCIIVGMVIGIVVSVRSLLKREVIANLPIVLMTLATLSGWLGPIVAGTYVDAAVGRQQLPLFTMPIIILVWGLCIVLRERAKFLTPVTAALAAFLFSQSATAAWQKSWVLNPTAIHISDALAGLPADLTLALYWEAKPTLFASNRKMMVCPVVEEGSVYNWVTNYGWCTEGLWRWSTRRNWLAINTFEVRIDQPTDSSASSLIAKYGPPDREIEVEGRRILLYSWSPERETRVRSIICGAAGRFKRVRPC